MVTPRGGRRLLGRFSTALLDQRPGVAQHFGEPAMRVVQPADLRLERAKRDLECAADEAAREDVRLLVVQPAVDDALLGSTQLVIGRLTEPTFPAKSPVIESEKERIIMIGYIRFFH